MRNNGTLWFAVFVIVMLLAIFLITAYNGLIRRRRTR